MDFADHYLMKLDTLMSIPADKVLHPGPEPVHVFLQEACNLYIASLDDMEFLLTGGLRREFVEDLPPGYPHFVKRRGYGWRHRPQKLTLNSSGRIKSLKHASSGRGF
jgi:hypothetical protein